MKRTRVASPNASASEIDVFSATQDDLLNRVQWVPSPLKKRGTILFQERREMNHSKGTLQCTSIAENRKETRLSDFADNMKTPIVPAAQQMASRSSHERDSPASSTSDDFLQILQEVKESLSLEKPVRSERTEVSLNMKEGRVSKQGDFMEEENPDENLNFVNTFMMSSEDTSSHLDRNKKFETPLKLSHIRTSSSVKTDSSGLSTSPEFSLIELEEIDKLMEIGTRMSQSQVFNGLKISEYPVLMFGISGISFVNSARS